MCGTIAFDNTPADTLRNGAEIFIVPAINQENGNSQIYKRFTEGTEPPELAEDGFHSNVVKTEGASQTKMLGRGDVAHVTFLTAQAGRKWPPATFRRTSGRLGGEVGGAEGVQRE